MKETSSIWTLQNIDAQGIFCPQKLGQEADGHSYRTYQKGEVIFEPSNTADKLYFVNKGRVKITTDISGDKTVTKSVLETGEIFGELAAVGADVRRDYAVAMEATQVCEISRDEMTQLFRNHHPLYAYIMNLIGNRAISMERRLESLVFKDSRSRILEFLLDLNDRKGHRVGYEWVVRRFLTHQEIANITATSRQTVTTTLNDLRAQNIITFDRRRLLIRDLDALKGELT